MNLVFACLSNSFSLLHDNLARQSILGSRFFPFSTLNALCHSLLACNISAEKSADSLNGVPLYVFLFFSCCLQNSLFNFCCFNFDMSYCGSVWVHCVWDPLCFLFLDICFLVQIWEVFSIISSNTFFNLLFSLSSFWNPYNVNIGILIVIPEIS